jgi:ribonucleoside-diphosphate reductase alpha chain
VPGLYDAFFADQDKFDELYVKYENDPSIRKKSIKAMELFSLFMQERASTGRIYLQNVDHCNTHSPFDPKVAPVRQSNLCLEIALPTKPLEHVMDPEGEIALCTLSAFNLGAIKSLDELEELADLAVRALDSLLDYQDYPVPAARNASLGRRTLGIGVINFAYYLAKNGVKYSDHSANGLIHKTFEAIQYYLMKASNNLAIEQGPCPLFNETTYSQGLMPIDTYKKDIDNICDEPLHLDWDSLRESVVKHGLRNSTLSALMPSETSSQISNATNGIEPPRGHISIKSSKDGVLKQVVPDYENLKDKYELLWDLPSNDGYLQLCAIMQKFVDQTISANTSYDPSKYEGNKVPMKLLIKDLLTTYKLGIKTLYYHNTRDGAGESSDADLSAIKQTPQAQVVIEEEDDGCAGGACKI